MSITNRTIYAKGSTPSLGAAGYQFTDQIFGSAMARLTDADTIAAQTGTSFRSPGASAQRGWNSDSTRFYVTSTTGEFWAYEKGAGLTATRRTVAIKQFGDLTWSATDPFAIYGNSTTHANHHTITVGDFSVTPATYSVLFDCEVVIPDIIPLGDTYVGSCCNGNGIVAVDCGGTGQEYHQYVIWYPLADPGAVKILATLTHPDLGYYLHGIEMDHSGRFVILIPSVSTNVPAPTYPVYIWDTTLDTVTPLSASGFGHTSPGWGALINQQNLGTYDGLQWIHRDLLTPNTGLYEIVSPVLTPMELFIADHACWTQAQNGVLIPMATATYRYYDGPNNIDPRNNNAWRACDDEILKVSTDDESFTIERFAHHRSLVWPLLGTNPFNFWSTPRLNVAPDGLTGIFTSNWDGTLGTDVAESEYRQDVFLIDLSGAGDPPPPTHHRRGRFH